MTMKNKTAEQNAGRPGRAITPEAAPRAAIVRNPVRRGIAATITLTATTAALLTGTATASAVPTHTAAPGRAPTATGTTYTSAAELPAEARAVLERIKATGELSDSDRATLRKYPKVANMVHDPAAGTTQFRTVPDPARARGVKGRHCWISEGLHHAKTVLGFTFYKFIHRADWCSDGQNVLGVHYREHRFKDEDSFAVFRHLEENSVTPSPARDVRSRMRALVDNCTPVGCISSTHPWVQLNLRGDGFWYPASGQN